MAVRARKNQNEAANAAIKMLSNQLIMMKMINWTMLLSALRSVNVVETSNVRNHGRPIFNRKSSLRLKLVKLPLLPNFVP